MEPIRLDIRESGHSPTLKGRPYLRVYFRCANVYQRVYRDRAGTSYCARCPKCGGSMRFTVGPGGINQRFFELSC